MNEDNAAHLVNPPDMKKVGGRLAKNARVNFIVLGVERRFKGDHT